MTTAVTSLPYRAEDRVRFGARFLDENWQNWHQAIDLDTMDMSEGMACVGAQLMQHRAGMTYDPVHQTYMSFWKFKKFMYVILNPQNPGVLYAFMDAGGWWTGGTSDGNINDETEEYAALTEAWKQEVLARR